MNIKAVQDTVPAIEMSQFPWGILLMLGIVVVLIMTVRMLLK